MPKPKETIVTIDIAASPDRVFAALADLDGYPGWLPRTRTSASGAAVGKGTAYTDASLIGTAHGTVLEYEPVRLLVFQQKAAPKRSGGSALSITIRYELTPIEGGTRVVRTGAMVASGLIRAVGPLAASAIASENRRTLRVLKEHLEQR
ncbi:hypothetical protein ASE16_17340 [Leifsonia sp. Root227]|uniref:SRPBCC family protein n=1 Tax=Leifsonia sp. Root227 TaxID=1736496 RepID=UPI0006F80DD9|nr:SRPBCC family protein [Leifsonia sp. Root227]KRC47113.1 hypothetical protein ASE16_17340 [Leifsonia sp. Root227]